MAITNALKPRKLQRSLPMIRINHQFFGVLSLCCISIGAATSAGGLPPVPLRESGRTPESRVRELHFKDYSDIGVKHSVPCDFRYTDKYFGYLDDETYYRKGKLPFQSACYDATSPEVLGDAPVRFDASRNEWVRDISVALKRWASGGELRPEQLKSIAASIRTYPLNNVNARGFAYTEDSWTGDERSRVRRLQYCLFRKGVALCGAGDMGYLTSGEEKEMTRYTLDILRSIEFLPKRNDASSLPSGPAREPQIRN